MKVLISGGSSGIGKETCEYFSQRGHEVWELSRSGKDFSGVRHISCDICSDKDIELAVKEVLNQVGKIDLLICNAGYGISGSFEETKEKDYIRQFDVNVFGTVRLIQKVLPGMRQNKEGRILIVSSVASSVAIPFQSFYSSSKAALDSLCLAINSELRPFNISCASLLPGDLVTGFTDKREKSESETYGKRLRDSVSRMEKDEQNGKSANIAAKALYKMGTSKRRPKPITGLGFTYRLVLILNKFLPVRMMNYIVGKLYAP